MRNYLFPKRVDSGVQVNGLVDFSVKAYIQWIHIVCLHEAINERVGIKDKGGEKAPS